MFEQLQARVSNRSLRKEDIIETAMQTDLALYDSLKSYYNLNEAKDVAILGAFILLSKFLHKNISKVSTEIIKFSNEIDSAINAAKAKIKKEGINTYLKQDYFQPLLGFTVLEANTHHVKIKEKLIDCNNGGEFYGNLVFRHVKNRNNSRTWQLYLKIPQHFIDMSAEVFTAMCQDASGLRKSAHAHITLHDEMKEEMRLKAIKELCNVHGVKFSDSEEITVLKRDIKFDITGSYSVFPKTNSTMKTAEVLRADCPEIELILKKYGPEDSQRATSVLRKKVRDKYEYLPGSYFLHITFGLVRRVQEESIQKQLLQNENSVLEPIVSAIGLQCNQNTESATWASRFAANSSESKAQGL